MGARANLAPAIQSMPRKQPLKKDQNNTWETLEMNANLMTKGKAELCKTN